MLYALEDLVNDEIFQLIKSTKIGIRETIRMIKYDANVNQKLSLYEAPRYS